MCDMVNRIREEMEILDVKQKDIIEYTGEKQSNISKYLSLNEKTRLDIPNTILAKISDILDVDIKYLLCMQDEKKKSIDTSFNSSMFEMINYVDLRAGAGAEVILHEYIESEPIPIAKQFLNGVSPKNIVVMKVVGDSMEPTIKPDEFVMVDMVNGRQFHPVDGVYLINKDGTIQIKRLHFKGDKGIDIISDNSAYPKENTINDAINLEVIGKLFKQIKNLGALAIK
ncbi:XRE family transcriptional regulator [Sulfurovum sp. XTW-4]|uniref:XRE family transcriptional regulator n=1 Tax=Sulfurovum xiamenensis TaxID=3019066 RepID=A0ABT7QUJ9_9BACT|nr:XRE family transcriptional regulator [Sulfurovum xiamenensis]MDM5264762.1 XRE family transcriptional regulator [Sulfurovum xiamenensis]